MARGQHLSD